MTSVVVQNIRAGYDLFENADITKINFEILVNLVKSLENKSGCYGNFQINFCLFWTIDIPEYKSHIVLFSRKAYLHCFFKIYFRLSGIYFLYK